MNLLGGTAISRKVVEKSERDNPERYGIVSGFELTVFQRNWMNDTRGHGCMFASAKGK